MQLFDRFGYALISAVFGLVIGFAGWWLYGTAHSLNYDGPGMDPVLLHWLRSTVAVFAVLGLVFKEAAADFVADTFNAILHFEFDDSPGHTVRWFMSLVLFALLIAAIWFTTPR